MAGSDTTAVRFPAEVLVSLCTHAFVEAGVPPEAAEFMGWALVETDLRGIDSHGVTRLSQQLGALRAGAFNAAGNPKVVHEFGAIAQIDGDGVMGHLAARAAVDHAVELSAQHGVGVVTVRNSNPFGAAFLYSTRAARRDKIGFITTNGPRVMTLHGALGRNICNNPLSWAIPTREDPPIVLDMACMVVARGRISLAAREGRPIPEGWALDAAGQPTTDPVAALAGHLLPLGGPKGSGLAVINEVIAGALSGARVLDEVADEVVETGSFRHPLGIGHFVMALDPQAWMPVDEFKNRVEQLRSKLRRTESAGAGGPVFLPGEPEHLTRECRLTEGIPLGQSTVQVLREIDRWGLLQ